MSCTKHHIVLTSTFSQLLFCYSSSQISVLMDYHKSYAVEMPAFREQLVVVKKYDKELKKLKVNAGDSPGPDHYWVSWWVGGWVGE